jgi:hypothetical protein
LTLGEILAALLVLPVGYAAERVWKWWRGRRVLDDYTLPLSFAEFEAIEEKRAEKEERLQKRRAIQREATTCVGITNILRSLTGEEMCTHLWAGHSCHGGFAFESGLYSHLPEYLRKKSAPFTETEAAVRASRSISAIQHKTGRYLLTFLFPYPDFDVILEDVSRLNFGSTILVWDDKGKPIKIIDSNAALFDH